MRRWRTRIYHCSRFHAERAAGLQHELPSLRAIVLDDTVQDRVLEELLGRLLLGVAVLAAGRSRRFDSVEDLIADLDGED